MQIIESKKEQGQYCCAYRCTNAPVAKKGGLCHKHYARKLKDQDPVGYRYNIFKSNARRRGKEVLITIDEFREFCNETGYWLTPGLRGKNATIDRINNNEGYHKNNMQLLPIMQNVNKYHTVDKFADVPF